MAGIFNIKNRVTNRERGNLKIEVLCIRQGLSDKISPAEIQPVPSWHYNKKGLRADCVIVTYFLF